MDIIEKFKQYMLDNGITYEEAAKRIGWTRQNLCSIIMNLAESVVKTECGSITNLWNNQKNCGRSWF